MKTYRLYPDIKGREVFRNGIPFTNFEDYLICEVQKNDKVIDTREYNLGWPLRPINKNTIAHFFHDREPGDKLTGKDLKEDGLREIAKAFNLDLDA